MDAQRSPGAAGASHLRPLPAPARLAVTLFVVTLSLGYLAANGSLYWSLKDEDGDPAWSMRDVIVHYHGTRKSRLESKIRGTMKKELGETLEEREKNLATMTTWIDAPDHPKELFDAKVWPIVEMNCTTCHAKEPADEDKSDAPLESYDQVMVFVNRIDRGVSYQTLARMSHTHLFGIGMLVAALSGVLWLTGLPAGLKGWTSSLAFAGVIGDIGSWWLAKYSTAFAYTSGACGGLLGLCMAVFILGSFYDMWIAAERPQGGAP